MRGRGCAGTGRPNPEVWEPCSIGRKHDLWHRRCDYLLLSDRLGNDHLPRYAMIDIMVEESVRELGVEPQTENTPADEACLTPDFLFFCILSFLECLSARAGEPDVGRNLC